MSQKRKLWAHVSRLLDASMIFVNVIAAGMVGCAWNCKNPVYLGFDLGVLFGYYITVTVSRKLWGRCPLQLAANLLLYDDYLVIDKPKFWMISEKIIGRQAIPYFAIFQPVVCAVVLGTLYTVTFVSFANAIRFRY